MISYFKTISRLTLYPEIKVRLGWLGAVLQYPRKCKRFLSSLSIPTRSICNYIAKE